MRHTPLMLSDLCEYNSQMHASHAKHLLFQLHAVF